MKMTNYLSAGLLMLAVCFGMLACTNKWDENGDLDGLWRYDSIAYHMPSGDSLVSLAGGQRYMSVQLKLASFRDNMVSVVNGHTNETLSRFELRGDSLIFDPMYIHFRTSDSLLTDPNTTANTIFGISGNAGRFRVETYSKSRLVLNSDYARLYLVKF